jgi:hypothetical protein
MQDRIKEFMKQAGTDVSGKWMGADNAEKFAELIVRECIRYFNEDYQRDFNTLWREDLSKGMKEHFGVEE